MSSWEAFSVDLAELSEVIASAAEDAPVEAAAEVWMDREFGASAEFSEALAELKDAASADEQQTLSGPQAGALISLLFALASDQRAWPAERAAELHLLARRRSDCPLLRALFDRPLLELCAPAEQVEFGWLDCEEAAELLAQDDELPAPLSELLAASAASEGAVVLVRHPALVAA